MSELDDIGFIESPIEKKILDPIWSINFRNEWHQRVVTDSALVPLYLAKTAPKEFRDPFTSDELVTSLSTFFDRSKFYHILFNQWMSWLENQGGPGYVTKRTAIHLFAPMLVQELEGPHRYQLATLIDLCKSHQGDPENWRDRLYLSNGDKKYFQNLQGEAIDAMNQLRGTADSRDLNDAYDYVLNALVILSQDENSAKDIEFKGTDTNIADFMGISGHPNANSIRNSIAHADYRVDFGEVDGQSPPPMTFTVDGQEYSISVDRILEFISFHMSLLRALSSGIILAVLDTNLKADQDEQIQRIILGMGFQEEHILDLYDK
ncbi:hypothetical protein [Haloferax sp. ATCC BAA-644]|uniref:hypothetical protein n=1 Tax=Haloferax sp. ATCC BAA-644 TaxID=1227462 RepID=UPI0012674536|nr:hypothetical protein [Haloferax sp. ATCC BAA-644]